MTNLKLVAVPDVVSPDGTVCRGEVLPVFIGVNDTAFRSAPGQASTWTAPAGVTSVMVECYGSGRYALAVTPGHTYWFTAGG